MKKLILLASLFSQVHGEIKIITEQLTFGTGFTFEKIPAPATNDLGTTAKFSLISGQFDRHGAGPEALQDGKVPAGDDEPRRNFFFAADTDGGRLLVDLGGTEKLERLTTYSRHFKNRAPQVYTVYGSKSDKAPSPDIDLTKNGWSEIAKIDTRNPKKVMGGRHAANITGDLGSYRQLVFDIKPTEKKTPFGLTFFSEIDIVKENGPKLTFVPSGNLPKLIRFATDDKKYSFIVDATEAPQYADWVEKELKPVIIAWYPQLVAMLPSKNYQAPTTVTFQFRDDVPPRVPAYAAGSKITMNAPWFKNQLNREAKGCVIHELVHVVQNYWLAPHLNPNPNPTPSWITEGLADYLRWFLYEPESKGAHYSPAQIKKMKHDASYRISANFIDWVSRTHKKDLARLINDDARNGRYQENLWKKHTGKSLQELAAGWKSQ
jgi:hypothetical protein|tara:strand:+ start:16041 stop:17342 length:1302 start_codon:yes stop_codon:yes gene_type:complete